MIRSLLSKFFKNNIYPTKRFDWYKRKNYSSFQDFVNKQRKKDSKFYSCFKGLEVTEFAVQSNQYIDAACLRKQQSNSNKLIIMFQGRGEYYESRFRDMALICQNTDATVIGFNPRGFGRSEGEIKTLKDIVDDGMQVVLTVLSHDYSPDNIVLLGNSLGGAVIHMVNRNLYHKYGIVGLREINSNSFRDLTSVLCLNSLKFTVPKRLMRSLLTFAGWEIEVAEEFYTIGYHRGCWRREGDRTVFGDGEYFSALKIPANPSVIQDWLINHSNLILQTHSKVDPHNLSLNLFRIRTKEQGDCETIYDYLNKFLSLAKEDYLAESKKR